MMALALMLACAGHADPVSAEDLEVKGGQLTLADGTAVQVESGKVSLDGRGTAENVVAKDGALQITAPRTEWDLKSRTAILSGGVVAQRGAVELRCETMEVDFSSPGRVQRVTAVGQVRIHHGDRRGASAKAVLTTADGTIVLTGTPTLSDGANQMSGERIVLHMDADRVICDECRMVIDPSAVVPRGSVQ